MRIPSLNTVDNQLSIEIYDENGKIVSENYDIEYDSPGDISANYLSSVLTDVCGIPQTSSQKYLLDLMGEYPVINSRCFINSSGDISPISEYEDNRRLMEYSALQYNYLFDRSNMPEFFWSLKP